MEKLNLESLVYGVGAFLILKLSAGMVDLLKSSWNKRDKGDEKQFDKFEQAIKEQARRFENAMDGHSKEMHNNTIAITKLTVQMEDVQEAIKLVHKHEKEIAHLQGQILRGKKKSQE